MSHPVLEILGETIQLLPQRALFWQKKQTLILADLHLGKEETFRSAAIPIPMGSELETLDRLTQAIQQTQAQRVVILGDFWHARPGKSETLLEQFSTWRRQHLDVILEYVQGNHDQTVGDPPSEWKIGCHAPSILEPPFVLTHYPDPSTYGYVLSGHLHPGFRLQGKARQRLRLPCFWFGNQVAVLPAFGRFTGLADITPEPADRIFVLVEQEVIEVPNPQNKPE